MEKCNSALNYLVCENAIDILLCNKDPVAVVEDHDGLWTGQAIGGTTVVVINHNTEVVFGQYLFHQPVGTVALKTIVCSIEGDIMGVSPTIADTLIRYRKKSYVSSHLVHTWQSIL